MSTRRYWRSKERDGVLMVTLCVYAVCHLHSDILFEYACADNLSTIQKDSSRAKKFTFVRAYICEERKRAIVRIMVYNKN